MRVGPFVLFAIWSCCALALMNDVEAAQRAQGRIEGRVVHESGAGFEGATVLLNDVQASVITGPNGQFVFDGVPAGTHSLTVTLGEHSITIQNVTVSADATTTVEQMVTWDVASAKR